MDRSIIEDKGINAVSEYLSDIGYIKPYLSSNDKTPMWDGSLFVYKSKEAFNNERFDYRVPVQVKASEYDGDVFPKTTTFPIEVIVLQNYLKDGGLAFFKVLVKDKEKEIYCSFLTKPIIEDIINSCKGQTTKSILLSKVPQNGNDVLESLKRINLLRDHSLLDLSTLENRTDYKFRFQIEHLSADTDPQEYLATHYIDILFSLNGVPGEFYPKGGPVKIESSTSITKDVTIDGRPYYNKFSIAYKNDGKHFITGCFDIIISYNSAPESQITIHIALKAITVDDVINELKSLLAFIRYKSISFGDIKFDFTGQDFSSAPRKEWEENLRYWNDVKKLFTVLKIEPTFSPNQLRKEDNRQLETLIHGLLRRSVVFGDFGQSHLSTFVIGSQKVLVYAEHIKGREFRLFDIYEHLSAGYVNEDGKRCPTPILSLVFEQKELPSNVQVDNIVKTYQSYKKRNPHISLRANQDLLNMLNHYDLCHDERILKAAVQIATWLKNEKKSVIGNRNITLLNYLQVIRRQNGAFNDMERLKLYSLKTSDNTENFARYILLGDKEKALSYLAKISKQDVEFLKTLPIYHFMNECK